MFALYDVINHRCHVIWWSADKVRRESINQRFMVAELPSGMAEQAVEQKIPKQVVYEGIARYARHETQVDQPQE